VVSLHLRFTSSCRDVEDLLAERGLEISNETGRQRALKFGPVARETSGAGNRYRMIGAISLRWWSRSLPCRRFDFLDGTSRVCGAARQVPGFCRKII